MKGFALGLSLSIAFVLGCVSSPLVTRDARAQEDGGEVVPAHVPRWQHFYYLDQPPRYDLDRLNDLGGRGWQMVGPRDEYDRV